MRQKIKDSFPYITEMEIDQMIEAMTTGNFDLDDMMKAFKGFEDFADDLP